MDGPGLSLLGSFKWGILIWHTNYAKVRAALMVTAKKDSLNNWLGGILGARPHVHVTTQIKLR